jgi:RNA polymerase sigma-70 factor (ECF subfamily)
MDFPTLTRTAYQMARHAIPGLRFSEQSFHDWAAAQAIESPALVTHAVDLVLAAACAAGDSAAIAAFDQQYVRSIRPSVSRVALRPDQLDELRQTLRVRLLTGPAPKLRQYKGNGPLGAWIRVTAARIALELQEATTRHGRELGSDAAMNALVASDGNPELMAAKAQHREMFKLELQRCFRELDEREKTLLRMHYLHDMGIDEMSGILRVHRATVARWLVALRKQIFDQLCGRLQIKLNSGTAIRSLIRLVRSELDINVRHALDGVGTAVTTGA